MHTSCLQTRRISNGDALTAQRLALRDDSVDAVVFGNDAESHGCSLANQEPFKQAAGMATDQCGMQAVWYTFLRIEIG